MFQLRLAIWVLLSGLAWAQDPGCDFYQKVEVGRTYNFYSPRYPNNYSGTLTCRLIAECPSNYNCRIDCDVNIPSSPSCTTDRLLVSKSGDSQLAGAQQYCGQGILSNIVSDQQTISLALIAQNSRGGRFLCNLKAVPATNVNQCSCGYKKSTRIVGGVETGVNEFPMMAGIVSNSYGKIFCGGTIIDKRYILTAAHCVANEPTSELGVVVGEHDTSTGSETNAAAGYKVIEKIIHPQYNDGNYDNDIALLQLAEDIRFSDRVGPACLPFKFVNNDFVGSDLTVLGWGTTSIGGPTSNKLQKVNLNVISQSTCQQRLPGETVTSRQICTFTPGKDACQFDSGGPLLYTDPSTGLLFSTGIVSNGVLCASGSPGINTRVSSQLQWIMNNTPGVNYCRK